MRTFFNRINDFLFDSLVADGKFYLFTIVFLVYFLNPIVSSSGDTLPTQLLPLSLLKEFDFDLNEFQSEDFGVPLNEWNTVNVGGRLVSLHTVFPAVLAVPLYAPFVLFDYPLVFADIMFISKLFSILSSALSVVFLYMALKEITDKRNALYCSLIYAFATCTWSVSSQEMWHHASSQMFLSLSLYLLLGGLKKEKFIAYSGFPLACAVASRPPNLLIALIVSLYVLHKHRAVFPKFLLWAMPPALFLLSYSWVYFGSFLMLGQGNNPLEGWTTPLLYGLAGLLFSPSKGLFVYSPVLVLSFVGIYLAWKGKNTLFKYLAISIFVVVLLSSKWWEWHAGLSYGYRMLVDLTPILCLFLAPVLDKYYNKNFFRYALSLLVVYSAIVQLVGVYFFDGSWEMETGCYYHYRTFHPCLWDMRDSQLLYYAKKAVQTLTSAFN